MIKFFNRIKGPTIEKTIDPLYNEAKANLQKLTFDIDQLINYISQIENTLQKLSDLSLKLGNDISECYTDAPQEQLLKVRTNLNISKNFCALTNNFFIPRTNSNVIYLLAQFKEDITKANELEKNVKLLRKEYDKSRAMVTFLSEDATTDQVKMREAIDKMDNDNQKYSEINSLFINSVNALKEKRESSFEVPFKNLICLTSQYLMQVFTQLQKYRTTFPSNTFKQRNFSRNYPNNK